MHRRFRPTQKAKTGVRLRTVMYVGVCGIGLVLGFSFFVIQFLREETGHAADNPMVISKIEVIQDTTPVFRGTATQPMLRINIQTKGINHKLSLSSVDLSARGTSSEIYELLKNARLWTTGNSVHFTDSKQIGNTLREITKDNLTFNCTQNLQNGNNYFWLTYDILTNPIKGNFFADAECIKIKIGTLDYEPAISAPPGARMVLNNMPYYSTGNGDISALESWNTARDGSGKTPVNFSFMPATFHIQAGHIMKNTLTACLPTLLIEKNGVLNSNSDLKINLLEVQPGGTFIQQKEIVKPESVKHFRIRDYGNFIHANTGRLPGSRKTFDNNSNVTLTACSNITFADNFTWGNLVIDAKENTNVNFAGAFKYIKGDLEIRATGKHEYIFTSVSDTINISGDLIVNGGRLILCNDNNSVNLIVGKNITVKNGWLSDYVNGKMGKGKLEITGGTGFAFTNGNFQLTSAGSSINIIKPNTSWTQLEQAKVYLSELTVKENARLSIKGNLIGQIRKNSSVKIQKGGIIDMESAELFGEGQFILEEGGTITTSHQLGINSNSQSGCILTASRFFHSGANYFYTGYSSPQQTGVFTTVPESETVNNMGISKGVPTGILILNQNIKVKGLLVKTQGSINKNSYSLLYHEQGDETAVKSSLLRGSSL